MRTTKPTKSSNSQEGEVFYEDSENLGKAFALLTGFSEDFFVTDRVDVPPQERDFL